MVLSTFTLLCSHHHLPSPQLFHHPNTKHALYTGRFHQSNSPCLVDVQSQLLVSRAQSSSQASLSHLLTLLKSLITRHDTMKLLVEIIGKTFSGINYTNVFLGQSPKAIEIQTKLYKCRLPWWLNGKESTCQCRRHRILPWSRKLPHAQSNSAHAPLSLCSGA